MFLRSAILLLSLAFLNISVGFIVAMRIVTNIEMIARTMISSIRVKEEDLRIFLLLLFFIYFLYYKERLKNVKLDYKDICMDTAIMDLLKFISIF
jgi:hypothetical protein